MRPVGFLLLLVTVAGCGGSDPPAGAITLATTTSTRDSGLLDRLLPIFQQKTGIQVRVVAVGSGQALELGRRGDVDVLLTHAPDAEEQFVSEGYALERRLVMSNDFILLGPRSDSARVSFEATATAAFTRIADTESAFVSRGDESGTHGKEVSLWRDAGIQPGGGWYVKGGAGMAETLRMADEMGAYTLSDRGTFLSQRGRLDLVILFEGDPILRNPYSVIVVDPRKHPHVNADAARQFVEFLLSPEIQSAIGRFGTERFGTPLFFPRQASDRRRGESDRMFAAGPFTTLPARIFH